ncbi:hypothetical protein [Lysobacter firmicutimachus]|uniref:Uncharacterized protein n=1 Tax=Lysobacter firmicutimachus TaxID=1792846 RepID=A0ABU8D4M1_9GAMM
MDRVLLKLDDPAPICRLRYETGAALLVEALRGDGMPLARVRFRECLTVRVHNERPRLTAVGREVPTDFLLMEFTGATELKDDVGGCYTRDQGEPRHFYLSAGDETIDLIAFAEPEVLR